MVIATGRGLATTVRVSIGAEVHARNHEINDGGIEVDKKIVWLGLLREGHHMQRMAASKFI